MKSGRSRFLVFSLLGVVFLGVLGATVVHFLFPAPKVKLGSKTFTESVILADMAEQLVHNAGESVRHQRGLGGTRLVWEALRGGEIDVYPEYTGTIRQEILTDTPVTTEAEMRSALEKQGIRMSRPLGFSNPYAVGMKKDKAARLGIRTISDLANHPELKLGFTNEFMKRADGWPNLQAKYRLPQTDVSGLEHALAYQALEQGALDATDLYATDGEIRKFDLQVLEDDRHVFPAYQAVLLYRADLEERSPAAVAALHKMEGLISNDEMITMNSRTSNDKVGEARVAADFLEFKLGQRAAVHEASFGEELLVNGAHHLFLVAVSLLAAIVVAVPLGVLAARQPALGQTILATAGVLQTVPSLALLVFMVWLLRGQLGAVPAIIALFLYSLLPIVRNTYTGLHDIPIQVRESAEALGLPSGERLWLIELPLASRSILAGIKTAAVINVGNATLGGLIGAGGFGQPIFEGLRRNDLPQIFLQGALPAALLALAVQGVFELAERRLVPRGLRLKVEG